MRRRAAQGGRADQPGWQQQPEAQQPPPTWERQAQAQAEYRQAQQAYQQAEAEVERAQKSYQGAQQDVEQTQRLQRAQEEYRQAKAARELSRANYEAILSRYQDFERELHEAQQEYLAAQQALAGQLGRAAAVAGGGGGGWLARSDGFVMGVVRALLTPLLALAGQLREVPKLLAELAAMLRGTAELAPQLYCPRPGFVMRRTAQVLLVVAFFLVYVWAVDRVFAHIPRGIAWSQAHQGWLRRALEGAVGAARQRLVGG